MYEAYLNERYRPDSFKPLNIKEIAENFETLQESLGAKILKKPEGFMSYKLQGDAVIIYDFYVDPKFRGHTKAWDFHNEVINEARKNNKKVAITFCEFLGKNHLAGIKAMEVSGFKPAFETKTNYVFIKGI